MSQQYLQEPTIRKKRYLLEKNKYVLDPSFTPEASNADLHSQRHILADVIKQSKVQIQVEKHSPKKVQIKAKKTKQWMNQEDVNPLSTLRERSEHSDTTNSKLINASPAFLQRHTIGE